MLLLDIHMLLLNIRRATTVERRFKYLLVSVCVCVPGGRAAKLGLNSPPLTLSSSHISHLRESGRVQHPSGQAYPCSKFTPQLSNFLHNVKRSSQGQGRRREEHHQ